MGSRRLTPRHLIVPVFLCTAIPASAQDNWLNLRTKNFNIISNAAERDSRVLAQKLETFRFVISKIFNAEPVSPVPLTVIAFKSDASFTPYKPIYQGKLQQNVAGYFLGDEDQDMIALDLYANYSRPLSVVYHEYTHLLISYSRSSLPLWLNEGIAEFYSTFESENRNVSIGIPIRHHVLLLRNRPLMPLSDLFAADETSPAYHERDKQGIFYAESWALVHYLMMGDKSSHQAQLRKFISLVAAGENVDAAFTTAFDTTYAAMEKALHRYTEKDVYPGVTYTLETGFNETQVAAQPISEAEARCYLGRLLLRSHREKEAENYFQQALALDPKLSRAYEGMGLVAERRTNYEAAKDLFRKAIELDPANFIAHYQYAAMLWETREGQGSISRIAEEVRSEARKSARLVPGYVRPYGLLAAVSLATGEELNEGLTAISNAIKLEPQNKWFQLRLAELQARGHDTAAARKTLEPLVGDAAHPDVQQSARVILESLSAHSSAAPPTLIQRKGADDQQSASIEARASKAITVGNYQEAIDLYGRFPKARETEAHLGLALAYLRLRDYRASLDHAREAIRREPANARAHSLAGAAMMRAGSLDQAGDEVKKALELDAKDALAYATSAEIDFYNGRLDLAQTNATKAQSLGDSDPELWLLISRIAARAESFQAAERAYIEYVRSAAHSPDESRTLSNGVPEFYHYLSSLKVNQVSGPARVQLPFKAGADRRPYVKVRLNGVEANFVVGTGSALSVVSTQMAKRLRMPLIQQADTGGVGDTTIHVQFSVIDSLELGDLKITSVPCVLRDLEGYKNVPNMKLPDGFIGLSLLSHFAFQLDYKENVMRLGRSGDALMGAPSQPGLELIPLRVTGNGLMSIELELEGGRRVNALLDSGTSTSLISRTAVDSFRQGDSPGQSRPTRVVGAGGLDQSAEAIVMRNCRVGGLKPRDIRALILIFDSINRTSGFEQNALLGGEFLRDFRVTVDLAHGYLSLQP